MISTPKRWTRLGEALIVTGAIGLASPMLAAQTVVADGSTAKAVQRSQATAAAEAAGVAGATPRTGESGEGGEGGENGAMVDLERDDAAYLSHLGLVRGHLLVGAELYEEGAVAMAGTHMKHPGDELYLAIKPAMDARGASDFATALGAMSEVVGRGAPLAEVQAAHARLEGAVKRTQSVVPTNTPESLPLVVQTVILLLREAAAEYALGVVDGKVAKLHEYQDAFGFTRIARDWISDLRAEQRARAPEAIECIEAQLDGLLATAWPSLDEPGDLTTSAADLYGAAARIELAATGLRQESAE